MSVLIYVHIGQEQCKHLTDSINQALLFNKNITIYVLLSDNLVQEFPIVDRIQVAVIKLSYLDIRPIEKYEYLKQYRNAFWISTTQRFFYIDSFINKYLQGYKNIFHIENDVMLYTSLSDVSFSFFDDDKSIYMVKDSEHRVVPSVICYRTSEGSNCLVSHIFKTVNETDFFMNDMALLASYEHLVPLDFDPSKDNKSVWDGAAIGQFLGGVDPRNCSEDSIGFENETCSFKVSSFNIKKINEKGLYHYYINDKHINNLHIHSKKLYLFSSVPS